jgi:hypothetical protein
MKWLNAIRRYVGLPEKPLATTGDTSVLFVLRNHSPQTFDELTAATEIVRPDLLRVLRRLERLGSITVQNGYAYDTKYWIRHKERE